MLTASYWLYRGTVRRIKVLVYSHPNSNTFIIKKYEATVCTYWTVEIPGRWLGGNVNFEFCYRISSQTWTFFLWDRLTPLIDLKSRDPVSLTVWSKPKVVVLMGQSVQLYTRVQWFLKTILATCHVVPNCCRTPIPKLHVFMLPLSLIAGPKMGKKNCI